MSANATQPNPALLHIDASPRGDRSSSRKLGQKFLSYWRAAHPGARVISHDVGHNPPPFVTAAWVEGAFTPATSHSREAVDAIAISDRYVAELLAADELVITTPIYNLSIPAALKAWIDQIVRVGRTFAMKDGGYVGLATVKRAIVIVTSGGDMRPQTPGGGYNFVEPYLRAVLGFVGITNVEFVYAHSLHAGETAREKSLSEAESTVAELVSARAA